MANIAVLVLALAAGIQAFHSAEEAVESAGGKLTIYKRNSPKLFSLKLVQKSETPATEPTGSCEPKNPTQAAICFNNAMYVCKVDGEYQTLPCGTEEKRGYCDCSNKQCVDAKQTCGKDPVSTITQCYDAGELLPDSGNCTKFGYCQDKTYISASCLESTQVYDSKLGTCRVKAPSDICESFECPPKGYHIIPFSRPDSRRYYLQCLDGEPIVRMCPEKYLATKNGCVFQCPKAGYFQDPVKYSHEAGYYYKCYTDDKGNFIPTQDQCQDSKWFCNKLHVCLPGGCPSESTQKKV